MSGEQGSRDFWSWAGIPVRRAPKRRQPPRCKKHGTAKVRQTGKTPYRCLACEEEQYRTGS